MVVSTRFFTSRHPDIARRDSALTWACRMRAEIDEVVAKSKQTIAASQALMAQADRMLAMVALKCLTPPARE